MQFKQTFLIAAIMLFTSACIAYLSKANDQPLLRSFSTFPMHISNWQGATNRFDEKVYEVLGVDDSILANYRNEKGENVQLYIGYYESQREGEIIHSPKNCMPGSGWEILHTSLVPLGVKTKNGEPIKVIKMLLQNGAQRQVALYWFHSRGRVIASEYSEKIYLVWDAITKQRTDGSFIRLLSPVVGNDENQTTELLKQFTEQLFPILDQFIPA
jgi:EpsI family protein